MKKSVHITKVMGRYISSQKRMPDCDCYFTTYSKIPYIQFGGKWLGEFGFDVSDRICIQSQPDGSLLIKKIECEK